MRLLCRLGIHAKVRAEAGLFRSDLYHCRRCPAQWRIGATGYSWGTVRYRERLQDRDAPGVKTSAFPGDTGAEEAA